MPGPILALAVGLAVGHLNAATRPDRLFASWKSSEGATTSLVVDFTLERRDAVLRKSTTADGTVRLLRMPMGETYASCVLTGKAANGKPLPPSVGHGPRASARIATLCRPRVVDRCPGLWLIIPV